MTRIPPKKRTQIAIWTDAAVRLTMCHTLSGRLPLYIVTEYPKSGGTWLAQMLAAYLGVPFPRNERARLRSSVMHGHYLFNRRLRNVFCVIRDGRDVMVSAYHHYLFEHERNSPRLVARFRRALGFADVTDVRTNLPAFIEFMFTEGSSGRFHFRWDEFVRSWHDKGAAVVRYESLLDGSAEAMAPALRRVLGTDPDTGRLAEVARRFSFERMAGRKPGMERRESFLRKGIAGDWRNHFTPHARRVFDHFAGRELVLLGYEADGTWATADSGQVHPGAGR